MAPQKITPFSLDIHDIYTKLLQIGVSHVMYIILIVMSNGKACNIKITNYFKRKLQAILLNCLH